MHIVVSYIAYLGGEYRKVTIWVALAVCKPTAASSWSTPFKGTPNSPTPSITCSSSAST